jgi:GTP-binding protein Era
MTEYKSGFITILGKPNVGKSTLVNALLGQKVAAVSHRPQTTRRRQLGILTLPDAQLVFIDTPGVNIPRHKLAEFFNQEAEEALQDVDVILFMVDAEQEPDQEDIRAAKLLTSMRRRPTVLVGLNKIDKVPQSALEEVQKKYGVLLPAAPILAFSAATHQGLGELIERIKSLLPERPPEYPEEQVTDLYEREIAIELIREAALVYLQQEVPHALAVRLDEFKERDNGNAFISATLLVEHESQKGIVIGQGAAMLKKIGSAARREIESMSGRKVFLDLRVKVAKDWRDDENALRRLGYKIRKKK